MGHMLDLMGSFGPTLQMKLFGPLHGLSSTLIDIGSFKGLKPFHFCFPIPQIIVDFFFLLWAILEQLASVWWCLYNC